jgi:hypothetical protein
MVKIFVTIAFCLSAFWSPAHTFGQTQTPTQTQNILPKSLPGNKSSGNDPLDLSLDKGEEEKYNKSYSKTNQKKETNNLNKNVNNKNSVKHKKTQTEKYNSQTPPALLGGYGQGDQTHVGSTISPLSSYLNDNKIEGSLEKSFQSRVTTKRRSGNPKEEEPGTNKNKGKMLGNEGSEFPEKRSRSFKD